MPADEVISCPACRHLLRVPADWLGTRVQCPKKCRSLFQAPLRAADGTLTEPELAGPAAAHPVAARRPDRMLLLPAFGLMITGTLGAIVAASTLYAISQDPAGMRQAMLDQVPQWRQMGLLPPPRETRPSRNEWTTSGPSSFSWGRGSGRSSHCP